MRNKFLILVVLIILGSFFYFRPTTDLQSRSSVAWLLPLVGITEIKHSVGDSRVESLALNQRAAIFESDTILVSEDSEAELQLFKGTKLRIFPRTEIILNRDGGELVLVVNNGSIWIDGDLRESFWISQNGERLSANQFKAETAKQNKPVFLPTQNNAVKNEKLQLLPPDRSQADILFQYFNHQKTIFQRCFTNIYQVNPQAAGNVRLRLRVEPSGKVSQAEVLESFVTDHDQNLQLKECLEKTATRLNPNSFDGNSVDVILPLSFE